MTQLVAVALLVAISWAAPARAGDIESDLVKQGVAACNDLEYTQAIALLEKALATETLTRDEKIAAFQTLAFAHVGLERADDALTDFENLLRVVPDYELDRTISPRVRAVFERAQAKVLAAQPKPKVAPVVLTPTVTPTRIEDGQAAVVSGGAPDRAVRRVELFYRTQGVTSFSKLTATTGADGHFKLTVPGMQVHAPALEYYLVVRDDQAAALATAGSLAQPLSVAVQVRKKPVYAKLWFWGVVGGIAVVGAGVATAVALSTRGPSGPATVTIMPH